MLGLVIGESIFGYYYIQYRHIVDEKLQKPLFRADRQNLRGAEEKSATGQKLDAAGRWPRSCATRATAGRQ